MGGAHAAEDRGVLPKQSRAAPKPTVDEVRYEEAEAPTEEYNEVRAEEKKLQGEVDSTQDRLAGKQREIDELRGITGPLAAAGTAATASPLACSSLCPAIRTTPSTRPRCSAVRVTGRPIPCRRWRAQAARGRAGARYRHKALEQARPRPARRRTWCKTKLRKARKPLNSLTAEQRARMGYTGTGEGGSTKEEPGHADSGHGH